MKKCYSFNGIDFLLKETITNEERIELIQLTRNINVSGDLIEANLTREEANRFLELTLVADQEVSKEFYTSIGVNQAVEVLKDFMLDRVIRGE